MERILPKLRVSISEKCQLRCSFCGGEERKMENFQPASMREMLSTEKLLSILEKYIENGGSYVQFTGGEPLLRKDLEYLVQKTFEMGGIPEINTNGIALNVEKAKMLNDLGINVIKVSIPSFDREEYKKITGVDALEKVLKNICLTKDIVKIRVNMVATQDSMKDFEKAIDTCKEYGIRQMLLLELLYYPHVDGGIEYFREKYVDIISQYNDFVYKKLGAKFEKYSINNKFESTLYLAKSIKGDLEIYAKQANPVLRLDECYKCSHFCQEGVYELRLSTGGYLNFCNVCNNFGVDISQESDFEISEKFKSYKELLIKTKGSPFEEFAEYHNIL